MSERITVRSEEDNHVLFSVFKAYYPYILNREHEHIDHKHAEIEISSIISGSGVYCCNGRDYDFSAGDVFLHKANDTHYFKNIKNSEELSLVVVRFDPRFIWSPSGAWFNTEFFTIFKDRSDFPHKISGRTPEAETIAVLLDGIFEESLEKKPAYSLFMRAKLMTVLANLARCLHDGTEGGGLSPAEERNLVRMEESMKYILNHLDEDLSLDTLAQNAGMSRSAYSGIFKKLNGTSPGDYIISQRISLARYQLETSDEPIIEIMENCGFNNLSNFYRIFKKHTGKSPKDYRNFMKQNDN